MRVKRGFASRRRHNRLLKLAKGFRGRRGTTFKHAKLGVQKALQYQYRDRKAKKVEFRSLWITRINAAARINGTTYGKLVAALKAANIQVDRKVLAYLAVKDPQAFSAVVTSCAQ